MFCTQCGSRLGDSARFCTACGRPAATGQPGLDAGVLPAPRRLRRIISEKKIAGVCAGFAEYFDTDITLMRGIWIALLILPPNLGLIAYFVAWGVMPKR
jgi:phage shock protein C